jgi:hypothetical protein
MQKRILIPVLVVGAALLALGTFTATASAQAPGYPGYPAYSAYPAYPTGPAVYPTYPVYPTPPAVSYVAPPVTYGGISVYGSFGPRYVPGWNYSRYGYGYGGYGYHHHHHHHW